RCDDSPVWKCLWRIRHCLCLDGWTAWTGHHSDRCADSRRCALQPRLGLCHGSWDGNHHRGFAGRLFLAAIQDRKVADMNFLTRLRRFPFWAWFWFLLGTLYFILPLYATFSFSLSWDPADPFKAYERSFGDSRFWNSFLYS